MTQDKEEWKTLFIPYMIFNGRRNIWRWKFLLQPVPVLQGNQEHTIAKQKVLHPFF